MSKKELYNKAISEGTILSIDEYDFTNYGGKKCIIQVVSYNNQNWLFVIANTEIINAELFNM